MNQPPLSQSITANRALEMQQTTLVVDGVFFQLNTTGIARLWKAILLEWDRQPFASKILFLDRANSGPALSNIRVKSIPKYEIGQSEEDRTMLQDIVDSADAKLFASTYYTSIHRTPTIQMVYDMIPEVLGFDVTNEPAWQEKTFAFKKASYFPCISESTRRDLHTVFPNISPHQSTVIYPGIDRGLFKPSNLEEIRKLRAQHSITKPYFLMVGSGGGYKNALMLIEAFLQLSSYPAFDIVMVSGGAIPGELIDFCNAGIIRKIPLSDSELNAAYSGALALVYPSLYEGFGLPILEAMACKCPVITNNKASLPEVGGDAVLYATTASELATALCLVQDPQVRNTLIKKGSVQATKFNWSTAAQSLWQKVSSLSSALETPLQCPLPPDHIINAIL